MNEYFAVNKKEEWLNDNTLNDKGNYVSLKVVITPLHKSNKHDWSVKVITKTEWETKTYISDLSKVNNGKTFAHQGLPLWQDGKFVSDGYHHPFYRNVENSAIDSIFRNEVKHDEVWAGLMKSAEYNFTKVEPFGLVCLFIYDNQWYVWLKHNGFEIKEQISEKSGQLIFETKSKKILGG